MSITKLGESIILKLDNILIYINYIRGVAMNFLVNLFSDLALNLGNVASTMCSLLFFELEMPKSMREE